MAQFNYRGKSVEGKTVKDTIIAVNEVDAREKLAEAGVTIESIAASISKPSALARLLERTQRVKIVEKMFFTQHLHIMVKTGFSLSRALATLALQTKNKYLRHVLEQIRVDVESGTSFSKAMAKHPRVFSEMYVNMVAAGETSGKLDEVLKRLAVQIHKDHTLISRVKGALTYPIVVVAAMIGVAIVTMIFVIPRLTEIFTESNIPLPLPTRILIAVSTFMAERWYIVVAGAIILFVLALRFVRTPRGKRTLDSLLLRLPVVAPIVEKINLARFTRTLSSLLQTDIPIVQSFTIIASTLGNTHYKNAALDIADKLKTGVNISSMLQRYPRLFPPVARQMVAIGEESGTLDTISGEIAIFYEEEVDQTMNSLSSLIEPILMLLLGVGVAGMAISIILPIYQLSQAF